MVDSTSGLGPIQNIASSNRAQADNSQRADTSGGASAPADAVEISPQALSALSEAQGEEAAARVAQDTRSALEQNLDLVLGIDPSFIEQQFSDT